MKIVEDCSFCKSLKVKRFKTKRTETPRTALFDGAGETWSVFDLQGKGEAFGSLGREK